MTVQRLVNRMVQRALTSPDKYAGQTIDRTDLSFEEWADHAIDEHADAMQYLQRAKEESAKLREQITALETRVADFEKFCNRLITPDALGFVVSPEVRQLARALKGPR